ncbi:MAG TPA: hypothetical protein VMU10_06620, partial [Desulfomonilia bacterium]|nr:hypothetical protein [Desulfomonilia bacterium]
QGEIVVAWQQSDGSNERIYRSVCSNGARDKQGAVSPSGEDASNPQVAVNGSGEVVVVWQQSKTAIYMTRYSNAAWSAPVSVSFEGETTTTIPDEPRVAMAENGRTVVIWQQAGLIKKIEYDSGVLSTPVIVSQNNPGSSFTADFHSIAMDRTGNTIIVWRLFDGAFHRVYMNEYRDGSWAAVQAVSQAGYETMDPQVAMDGNGNAVIVWLQGTGGAYRVFMCEYRRGAWSTPAAMRRTSE